MFEDLDYLVEKFKNYPCVKTMNQITLMMESIVAEKEAKKRDLP